MSADNDIRKFMIELVRVSNDSRLVDGVPTSTCKPPPDDIATDKIKSTRMMIRFGLAWRLIVFVAMVVACIIACVFAYYKGQEILASGNRLAQAESAALVIVVTGLVSLVFLNLVYTMRAKWMSNEKMSDKTKLLADVCKFNVGCLKYEECLRSASVSMWNALKKMPLAKKMELSKRQADDKMKTLKLTTCVTHGTNITNVNVQNSWNRQPLRFVPMKNVTTFESALATCMHTDANFVACVEMKNNKGFFRVYSADVDATKPPMVRLVADDTCKRIAIRADAMVVIPRYDNSPDNDVSTALVSQTRTVVPGAARENPYDENFLGPPVIPFAMNFVTRRDDGLYIMYPNLEPSVLRVSLASNVVIERLLNDSRLRQYLVIRGADLMQAGLDFFSVDDTYQIVGNEMAKSISNTYDPQNLINRKISTASKQLNGILTEAWTLMQRKQHFADYDRAIYKLASKSDRDEINSNIQSVYTDLRGYFQNSRIDEIEQVLINREKSTRSLLSALSFVTFLVLGMYIVSLDPRIAMVSPGHPHKLPVIISGVAGVVMLCVSFLSWNESALAEIRRVRTKNTERLFTSLVGVSSVTDFFANADTYKRLVDVMDFYVNTDNILNPNRPKMNAIARTCLDLWTWIQKTNVLIVLYALSVGVTGMTMFNLQRSRGGEEVPGADASQDPGTNTEQPVSPTV